MILVFVGAGGSAAVDPEQYPVTRRFFEKLPKEIRERDLYTKISAFLTNPSGRTTANTVDIEDILEALDDFKAQYKSMMDPDGFIQWFIGSGFIDNNRIIPLHSLYADIVPLDDEIKGQVYTYYGKRPDPNQLHDWEAVS